MQNHSSIMSYNYTGTCPLSCLRFVYMPYFRVNVPGLYRTMSHVLVSTKDHCPSHIGGCPQRVLDQKGLRLGSKEKQMKIDQLMLTSTYSTMG